MPQQMLTREQARQVDTIAIEQWGMSSLVLMENAGRGVIDILLSIDSALGGDASSSVAILCGKGNNGGDGFVIARHLAIRGIPALVVLLTTPEQLQGDALTNYQILRKTDVSIVDLSRADDVHEALSAEIKSARWLVDAMLGTGARGEPRHPFAAAIDWMNAQSVKRLAIDIPSGLDCDSGLPAANTLRADDTCTFVAPKIGFASSAASEYIGKVHVVDIGVPTSLLNELSDSE